METNSTSYDYSDILRAFGKDKIEQRYEILHEYLVTFIKRHKYEGKVDIADSVLNQAVVDYFADIHRLKNFHHIEAINFVKIHAYTAYWILRRKPLQIIEDDPSDLDRAFVNERFVASYLLQYLRGNYTDVIILESERPAYYEFVKNLEYYLRYRTVTPQMLETMLEAYKAGMAFERSAEQQ
ncbi:MAG: hypothetical protein LUC90_11600 [Lachnospiraceae bacterium]|nr:hypothetical protein [Lachnospiraceae bacterium]